MLDNAVVAVLARHGLATSHEVGVAILELASAWDHLYALEVQGSLIPAEVLLRQSCHGWWDRPLACWDSGVDSLLILEVLHGGSLGLDNNEVDSLADFISFGKYNVAGNIVTNVLFQHRVHTYLINVGQECNGVIHITDQCLPVKIAQI